ncbi:hypothetical protein RFI_27984 [Reticulomyxa filosa]|uniref:Transmembrane protein n=1 Tax=Reticulomyxa filosa TaxID=46433 RepID=X6M674_RETFI|nr:hypothetical protein RFI_27984 [Reticulomyxa filosa]|eukprot:ETO09394.1 hypothetical protein RFI_27984 [Reticulomyxa filosa]
MAANSTFLMSSLRIRYTSLPTWFVVWLFGLLFCSQFGSVYCCRGNEECGSVVQYQLCVNHECVSCSSNSDCTLNTNDYCAESEGYCKMDSALENFGQRKLLTIVIIFLGSVLAAGGGLGGGGFDAKAAGALSLATIFGGSIVNLTMNFLHRHPNRTHRALPDLSTILVLEPMLLAGTSIGVLLNKVFPDPMLLLLLVAVLGQAAYRTSKKGMEMWRQENETRRIEQEKQKRRDLQDMSATSLLIEHVEIVPIHKNEGKGFEKERAVEKRRKRDFKKIIIK